MTDVVSDGITEAELLAELHKYLEEPTDAGNEPGTITTRELAAWRKISIKKARTLGAQLIEAGVLEAGIVGRINEWGSQPVKGYRYIGVKHDPLAKTS